MQNHLNCVSGSCCCAPSLKSGTIVLAGNRISLQKNKRGRLVEDEAVLIIDGHQSIIVIFFLLVFAHVWIYFLAEDEAGVCIQAMSALLTIVAHIYIGSWHVVGSIPG